MKLRIAPAFQMAVIVAAAATLAACDRPVAENTAPAAPPASESAAAPAAEGLVVDAVTVSEAVEPVATLADLKKRVGTYPNDGASGYLAQGALAEQLKTMLGGQYDVLMQNLAVASPLTQDGERLFVTGNRQNEGGSEMAAVVVDPAQNAVRVWLVTDGKSQIFQNPEQAQVAWPQDVQVMMENFSESSGQPNPSKQ